MRSPPGRRATRTAQGPRSSASAFPGPSPGRPRPGQGPGGPPRPPLSPRRERGGRPTRLGQGISRLCRRRATACGRAPRNPRGRGSPCQSRLSVRGRPASPPPCPSPSPTTRRRATGTSTRIAARRRTPRPLRTSCTRSRFCPSVTGRRSKSCSRFPPTRRTG